MSIIEVQVNISRDDKAKDIPLPRYETPGSAGMDLRAAKDVLLLPGERGLVPTGLHIAIPDGFEAQLRPRSGIALKHGVTLMNTPGTIDSDYRGEIKVLLVNYGADPFTVNIGDRIAQLVLAPVYHITWVEQDKLSETKRGEGGFGSSGEN